MKKILEKTLDSEMAMPLPESQENLKGDSLESLLDGEEDVIWKGMPKTTLLERPKMDYRITLRTAIGSSLIFILFLWTANFVTWRPEEGFMLLIMISLASIAVYFIYFCALSIYQRFYNYSVNSAIDKRGQIRYFYTNEKIIFKTEKNYHSIPFDHIKKITFTSTREGHGTIYFIIKKEFRKKVLRTKDIHDGAIRHSPTFEVIPDVAKFHRQLVRVFNASKK